MTVTPSNKIHWDSTKPTQGEWRATKTHIEHVRSKKHVCVDRSASNVPTMYSLCVGGPHAQVKVCSSGKSKEYYLCTNDASCVEFESSDALILQQPPPSKPALVRFEKATEPKPSQKLVSVDKNRVIRRIAEWLSKPAVRGTYVAQMAAIYTDEIMEHATLQRLQTLCADTSFEVQYNNRTVLFTTKDSTPEDIALDVVMRYPAAKQVYDAEALLEHLQTSPAEIAQQRKGLKSTVYVRAGPIVNNLFVVYAESGAQKPGDKQLQLWAHAARSFVTTGQIVVPGECAWAKDFINALKLRSGGTLTNQINVVLPPGKSLDKIAQTLWQSFADFEQSGVYPVQVIRSSMAAYALHLRKYSSSQAVFVLPCNVETFIGEGMRINATTSVEADFVHNMPECFLHNPWSCNNQLNPNNWKAVELLKA